MAGMTDMEELLESICDEQIKRFMKEAYLCYMASAYKACIVMSFISVYEDLRRKIKELSAVNSDARNITREIEQRVKNNQPYESYLEAQLISNNIIDPSDGRDLAVIRDRRNLCAHPTTHIASPEEARYIYSIVIKGFLSKPLLKTIDRVNFIIDDLKNDNYFPSNYIDKISFIVSPIIETLHSNIFPYLLKKLIEKMKEVGDENNNYNFFLSGVVNESVTKKELQDPLAKKFISVVANDSKFEKPIVTALNINPILYTICEKSTQNRIKTFLNRQITRSRTLDETSLVNPVIFFLRLIEQKGSDYVVAEFNNEVDKLIKNNFYDPKTARLVAYLNVFQEEYITQLFTDAGSRTYDIANFFAENIGNLEGSIISFISDENCFLLLIRCFEASNWGARKTKSLIDSRFKNIPAIVSKAKEWALLNKDEAYNLCMSYDDANDIEDFIKQNL